MLQKLTEKYTKKLAKINEKLVDSLADESRYIKRVVENYGESRGKQLRPLITLVLANNFSSYDEDKVNELASIYEKIHIASLIHDDVIDHCSQRRARKTLNAEFGDEVAILLGDYVFANIFCSSAKYGEEFVEAVAQTISRLTRGELKQQENVSFDKQDIISYLGVIADKTSALLELVFVETLKYFGESEIVEASKKMANSFGKIFQIVDDWSDFCLVNQVKNFGSDAKNGFVTLPWILLYEAGNEKEKSQLIELWEGVDEASFSHPFIQDMFHEYNLPSLVEQEIFALYAQVQSYLAVMSVKIDYSPLQCLVDICVKKFEKISASI